MLKGVHKIGNAFYYFDFENGVMLTGLREIGEKLTILIRPVEKE